MRRFLAFSFLLIPWLALAQHPVQFSASYGFNGKLPLHGETAPIVLTL